jgi:hypothetical protein
MYVVYMCVCVFVYVCVQYTWYISNKNLIPPWIEMKNKV